MLVDHLAWCVQPQMRRDPVPRRAEGEDRCLGLFSDHHMYIHSNNGTHKHVHTCYEQTNI